MRPKSGIVVTGEAERFHVAYMMSRFPKLTETFVLDEILEMERCGTTVEIFPLRHGDADVVHCDARPLVARARFSPMINGRIALDNLRCLVRHPGRYLGTLFTLVTANRRSLRFLLGALALFPKACSFALEMRRLGVEHVHAHFASHPAAAAFVVGRIADIPWSFTAHGSDLHREQAQSEGGPVQIVCVGTLHTVKGQSYLLQACALLHDRGVDFTCHFIGDGPDRGMLENQTAALMEAAACGLPQVASRLSGIPELVSDGETGYLADPGDIEGLANAIDRVASTPSLGRRLGDAARHCLEIDFNLPVNVARLQRLMLPEVTI